MGQNTQQPENQKETTTTKTSRKERYVASAFVGIFTLAAAGGFGYFGKDIIFIDGAKNGRIWQMEAAMDWGVTITPNSYTIHESLTMASKYGQDHVIEFLLDRGADNDNDIRQLGWAVYHASENGHIDVLQQYIDNGFDINTPLFNEQYHWQPHTALISAVRGGQLETVSWLLDQGSDITINGEYTLKEAAVRGDTDMVKLLLESYPESAKKPDLSDAIGTAAAHGKTETVALLLEHVQPDIRSKAINEAIRNAGKNNHDDTAALLLDHGADPYFYNEGKILWAAKTGDIASMDAILADYPDILQTIGIRAMDDTAWHGQTEFMKALYDRGVDSAEALGRILPVVAADGDTESTAWILEKDLDFSNIAGFSPLGSALIMAAQEDRMDVAKLLLDHGADPLAGGELSAMNTARNHSPDTILPLFEEHIKNTKPAAPATSAPSP